MRIIYQLIFVLLSSFSFNIYANSSWIKETSTSQTWHKLIKYEALSADSKQVKSAIHDPSFFISKYGDTNPQAELEATIKAFMSLTAPSGDEHPQCKFPARYIWLKKILPNNQTLAPPVKCPTYDSWRFDGATDSISVVFATGYLNNPASFYGHTLLKMNSSNKRKTVNIEDVSVNYGAIVPNDEDPFSYIVKGMLGGYDAGFSHTQYYYHTHNYGENELRDLWEYELSLTKPQVDFVLAHVWEVLGKKYTYYFFRKNCSYRMAELLEIIPNLHIIPDNPIFIMPQVLMTSITDQTINGVPLVRSISYKESRQSKLYRTYETLTHNQRKWVQKISSNLSLIQSDDFIQQDLQTKTKVIDTLVHYQLYLLKKHPENTSYQESYRKILYARFKLPSKKIQYRHSKPAPPHKSRPPSRIAIGFNSNTTQAEGISLHYRPAYYDELDSDPAHVAWSSLSMGDVKLRISNGNVDIDHINLVAINSFNARATNLPEDQQDVWSLNIGLRRQHLACINCSALYTEGSLGYGYNIDSNTKILAEYGAGIQDKRNTLGNLYGFTGLRLISQITPRFTLQAGTQYRVFANGTTANDYKINLQLRYQLKKNEDIRLQFSKHHSNQLEIQYGFYF